MSSPSSPDPSALPPQTLAIHLDLVGGLAGDMFAAAMLDAFPALAAPLFAELAKVQPAGRAAPSLSVTEQAGLRSMRFGLAQPPATRSLATASAGRSYASLRAEIERSTLEDGTRREALALLALLAQAEAHAHGCAIDDVHFHELADWDSLLDVVAAGFVAARLDSATWTASPLPLGSGTVKTAHGLLPLPAPATAHLLAGFPWKDDGIGGERITPTGAAILARLVAPDSFGRPRPAGRLLAVGVGAGTRRLPGLPNVTRALVFERRAVPTDAPALVTVVEFDVDDMTGEELALAAERLRAMRGVLDASVGTRIGKKGRPLSDFRLLVEPGMADAVAKACFVETSTLGLRVAETRRHVLRRDAVEASAGDRDVGVKIARRPDGSRTAKADHDDVASAASLDERRAIRTDAERDALKRSEP